MENCPPEVLISIVNNLPPKDLVNLTKTCRSILYCLGDDYFRNRLYSDIDMEFFRIPRPYRCYYESWYDLYRSLIDSGIDMISYKLYQLNRKISESYDIYYHQFVSDYTQDYNDIIDMLVQAIDEDDMVLINSIYYYLTTINDAIFIEVLNITQHLNRIYPILYFDVGINLIDKYISKVADSINTIKPTLLIESLCKRYWIRWRVINYILHETPSIRFVESVIQYMDDHSIYHTLSNYILTPELILSIPRFTLKDPIWFLYKILSKPTVIYGDQVIRKIIRDNNITLIDIEYEVISYTNTYKVQLFLNRVKRYLKC
jgi:hypothetical protein